MSGPVKKIAGEAAKANGLLGNLAKVLPWKITGPASGAEWKEVPIGATEYRVTAPANQPSTVRIPHAEPERIYDVRYHTRDTRRKYEPVLHGDVYATTEYTPENIMQNMEALVSLKDGAFTPGARHGIQDLKGYEEVSILEQTNGGYT